MDELDKLLRELKSDDLIELESPLGHILIPEDRAIVVMRNARWTFTVHTPAINVPSYDHPYNMIGRRQYKITIEAVADEATINKIPGFGTLHSKGHTIYVVRD